MIQITKSIEWDMGHRVPHHKGKCRNLHGHRYKLELTLTGIVNRLSGDSSEGMIIDFYDIKTLLQEKIYNVLDHSFMVYENDKIMTEFFMKNSEENFKFIKVPFIPTVENISFWCYSKLKEGFPSTIIINKVRVAESPGTWADYIDMGNENFGIKD